jgi:hypothetical protein
MMIEHLIMLAMWLSGIVGMILFIPKNQRRKGIFAFLLFQAVIWLSDMPAFSYNLLSAPVRVFPKATDLPLTINYFFYPALFAIYYVNRRKKVSLWSKFIYLFVWIAVITLYDIILEKYTDLLEYGLLTWYGMWIYIGLLFIVSHVCCNWYYKNISSYQANRGEAS